MRKIKAGTVSMLVVCVSVYDTKPVHLMSTAHNIVTLDTKMRKVWSYALGTNEEIPYKRLNIIDAYNHDMNSVDRQDHLRGNYRPDGPWMRNNKWYETVGNRNRCKSETVVKVKLLVNETVRDRWWAVFLWSLGVAATNAYLVYKEVCAYHKVAKKKIMSHRDFLCELCDMLCHPEKRPKLDAGGQPYRPSPTRASSKARAGSAPPRMRQESSTAAKASRKRPATTQGEDEGRAKAPGPKGSNHVTTFNASRHEQVKADYDTNPKKHIMIEPTCRLPCQVCYYMHTKNEYEGRAPQTTSRMVCEECNHACCSPTCWNIMHGIEPRTRAP